MIKNFLKISLCALFFVPMWGCWERMAKHNREEVVASVGNSVLYASDVKGIYAGAISGEDSVKLLEGYVNTWVRKQVKLQEAEKVLESSGVDIEAMVNDYRNSLLIQRLDQYYVNKHLDTLIPASLVDAYYNQHKSEFLLDRTVVRGRIVRLPETYRQQAKLKELMASTKADRQQDFLDLCVKNNFEFAEFDTWTDFRQFLTYLPTTRGKSYDYLLGRTTVQEMSDGENKYFFQIKGQLKKGDQAPLERVEPMVRRIIFNQRSSEIIRRSEDSLYHAAMRGENVIINL